MIPAYGHTQRGNARFRETLLLKSMRCVEELKKKKNTHSIFMVYAYLPIINCLQRVWKKKEKIFITL